MECDVPLDLGNGISVETIPTSMLSPIIPSHCPKNTPLPSTNYPNGDNLVSHPLPQTPPPPFNVGKKPNPSFTPPITMQNPLITTPVFSRSKSSPSLILNPSLSRKRQRRRSPVIMDATSFDLNSPPPIPNRAQPNNPYESNTAPAMHNKHTEFSSRYSPPPISFESPLNKEFPPLLSTLNVPSPPPNPPQPPPTPYPLPIAEETLVSSLPPFEIELKETIRVGECIGIHLAGYEDMLAEILSETRANQSSQ